MEISRKLLIFAVETMNEIWTNRYLIDDMGSIFIIEGILIYIYAFDHNPPHLHVRCGDGEFTITIKDRIVEGKAKAKTIQVVNQFIDDHENEIMEIWKKAQRGEKIEKIRR